MSSTGIAINFQMCALYFPGLQLLHTFSGQRAGGDDGVPVKGGQNCL